MVDYPEYTKEQDKALEMAQELLAYCCKHNFPRDTQLAGMIIFGEQAVKEAFLNGQDAEKRRLQRLFGL